MILVILGGNHVSNKGWVHQAATLVGGYGFDRIIEVDYEHWTPNHGVEINIDVEVERFLKIIADISNPLVVLAKSAGIIVALRAAKQMPGKISRIVALGVPEVFASERGIDIASLFMVNGTQLSVIQQKDDPQGGAKKISDTLKRVKIVSVVGEDHIYAVVGEVLVAIKEELGSCGKD